MIISFEDLSIFQEKQNKDGTANITSDFGTGRRARMRKAQPDEEGERHLFSVSLSPCAPREPIVDSKVSIEKR